MFPLKVLPVPKSRMPKLSLSSERLKLTEVDDDEPPKMKPLTLSSDQLFSKLFPEDAWTMNPVPCPA